MNPYHFSAYQEWHYRPNLKLEQTVEALLDENERLDKLALKGWCILIAFLVTMHVGLFRLIFSLI